MPPTQRFHTYRDRQNPPPQPRDLPSLERRTLYCPRKDIIPVQRLLSNLAFLEARLPVAYLSHPDRSRAIGCSNQNSFQEGTPSSSSPSPYRPIRFVAHRASSHPNCVTIPTATSSPLSATENTARFNRSPDTVRPCRCTSYTNSVVFLCPVFPSTASVSPVGRPRPSSARITAWSARPAVLVPPPRSVNPP